MRNTEGGIVSASTIGRDITERKRAEQALRESEAKFRTIIEQATEGVALVDEEGNIVEWNQANERMTGLRREEIIGKPFWDIMMKTVASDRQTPQRRDFIRAAILEAVQTGQSHMFEAPLEAAFYPQPGGEKHYMHQAIFPVKTEKGYRLAALTHDITARKKAEETQRHLNRELRAISKCNETLLRAVDEQTLLNDICHIVCDEVGYRMAWVGYAEHDNAKTVRPVAWAGSENGYLTNVDTSWADDTERGRGPVGIAIRSGELFYVQDFGTDPRMDSWRESALQRGYHSTIALPLKDENANTFGGLFIYASEPDAITPDEIRLLEELASDLAFGIVTLRTRAERRRAEEALREKTEELDRYFTNALDLLCIADTDGYFRRLNPEWESTLGFPISELQDRRFLDFVHPDDLEVTLQALSQLAEQKEVLNFTNRYRCKSGAYRWIEWRSFPMETNIYAVARDITDRRRVEEELQRNREAAVQFSEQLSALQEATIQLSKVKSSDDLCRRAVELARSHLGFDRVGIWFIEEDCGLLRGSFGVDEQGELRDERNLRTEFRPGGLGWQVFSQKRPVAYSERTALVHQGQELGEGNLAAGALWDGDQVIGLIYSDNLISHQPITEQQLEILRLYATTLGHLLKRNWAEEALSQRTRDMERLTTAIEQAAETVVITDTQGDIVYVNPAFERVTGYSRAEALGQNPRILKSDRHDLAFYQSLWATICAGQVWSGHFINKRKDGTLYTEEATISPVKGQDGTITHYVAVKRDVTRERELEEQYRQAQKLQAIGQLTAGIAHDFNNLLTAINGFAELAQDELVADHPLQNSLGRILDAGERATKLISQLMTFSRKRAMESRVLNLNTVVLEMDKILQRIIGEHIILKTILAVDLGLVKVDPAQFEQVIVNLAVNARDAMPRGGHLTVETANVALDQDHAANHPEVVPGEYVLLTVSDSGIGMSEEIKSRIFEPFFTTKKTGEGTGLGLATVFGIVKQSGGHIAVDSEPGLGTTFKIYLPIVDAAAASRTAPQAKRATHYGTETILLVEDDELVRLVVQRTLQAKGYNILEACSGGEALSLVGQYQEEVDLLLTDVVMPRMSGQELAEKLRTLYPQLRVLFMSGYTDDTVVRHGMQTAKVDFLNKPFSPNALTSKVREILDQ